MSKLSMVTNTTILHTENPKAKYKTKKSVRINEFIILQQTKSTYKNYLFLYTNNKLYEKENLKIIIFAIASKIMEYLEIN